MSLFCIPSGTMGTISSEVSMRFSAAAAATWSPRVAPHRATQSAMPTSTSRRESSPCSSRAGRCARPRHHQRDTLLLRALTQSWNDQPERASRPFSADATDSFSPKARGCSCSKTTSTPRAARALASSPRSKLHLQAFIRCAWRFSGSRRARLPSLSKKGWRKPRHRLRETCGTSAEMAIARRNAGS